MPQRTPRISEILVKPFENFGFKLWLKKQEISCIDTTESACQHSSQGFLGKQRLEMTCSALILAKNYL
jgi:hypothetical protein